MAVITDERYISGGDPNTGVTYATDPVRTMDYYPFGLEMNKPATEFGDLGDYRFGFNGKEADSDNEWGSATHYDYGFRIYNPSIGKFLSVDPLAPDYPGGTPYGYAGNSPIYFIDIDGLVKYPADKAAEYRKSYPVLTNYLENGGLKNLLQNEDIRNGLKITGGYSDDQIDNLIAEFNQGIEIQIVQLCEECPANEVEEGLERNGYTAFVHDLESESGRKTVVQIDIDLVTALEKSSEEDRNARLLGVVSTLIHETIHYGEHEIMGQIPNTEKNMTIGSWERKYDPYFGTYEFFHEGIPVGKSAEGGRALESGIWYLNSEGNTNLFSKQGNKGLNDQKELIQMNAAAGNADLPPIVRTAKLNMLVKPKSVFSTN